MEMESSVYAPLPMAMYGSGACFSEWTDSHYLFGGQLENGSIVDSIYQYSVSHNEWTLINVTVGSPSKFLRCLSYDEKTIIIYGGQNYAYLDVFDSHTCANPYSNFGLCQV